MDIIPDADVDGMDTIRPGLVPRRVSNDRYGLISMQPHEDLVAGSFVTLRFEYTVGEIGIATGGILQIGTPCTGWGKPLLPYSRYWYQNQPASYFRRNTEVNLKTSGQGTIEPYVEARMLRYAPPGGMWRWWIAAKVVNGQLNKGDVIVVTYGDTKWGEPGVQVQKFLEKDAYFLVLVDVAGNGELVEIPNSPFKFNVVAGPPERAHITVPSRLKLNQPVKVQVALTDAFWNPTSPNKKIKLDLFNLGETVPIAQNLSLSDFSNHNYEIDEVEPFVEPGLHRIKVVDRLNKLEACSNPAFVTEEEITEQIYWGDLHSQSKYHGPGASSVGSPDELYRYAREVTHLDFAAITDDVAPLSDGWGEIQQAAVDHYEPGEFVPFKAFEWCSKRYGHRNTIFANVEIEDNYPASIFNGPIEDFWNFLRRKNVIIIPHHTFLWTQWSYHDPGLEPLVEIHSCWGTSEKPGNAYWDHSIIQGGGVQAGLARGYRLGIIGSSDTCTGMPGRSIPNAERWDFHKEKGGLAAVYSPELTREAIFQESRKSPNLWHHRCPHHP